MLDTYIDAALRHRKQFRVYSNNDEPDVVLRLATRNVTVERRRVPATGPTPFVSIRDDEGFVGTLRLADLEHLLTPPIVRPEDREGLTASYRALLDVLEETVFSSLKRRQLLATSREIEDRARRVGSGTLRVTFQRFSNFTSRIPTYWRLGRETGLDIHIYALPDRRPPAIPNVTFHPDETGVLSRFWCVAFDGGPDPTQACVLIAREESDGFVGFWSYDYEVVADVLATLEAVGADSPKRPSD